MPHDTDATDRRSDPSTAEATVPPVTRRGALAASAATLASLGGCTALFGGGAPDSSTGREADVYTTVQKTTTFGYQGTRTPYPGVEQIFAGDPGGILVIAYYDYSHGPSIRWWRDEYPQLVDLLRDGSLRLTLLMFPLPVDRWSVMLPSALFEVQARADRDAAWEFHLGLVAADTYSLDLVGDLAGEVGVSPEAVRTAATDRRRRNQAFGDKQLGQDSGVDSLPAFRWGLDPIEGTSAEAIREFVESHRS